MVVCSTQAPFYGYVKRAMNRAPAPLDRWWPEHAARCNGQFVKVKQPDDYGEKKMMKKSTDAQLPATFKENVPSTSGNAKLAKSVGKNTKTKTLEQFWDAGVRLGGKMPAKEQPVVKKTKENDGDRAECPHCRRVFDVALVVGHSEVCALDRWE